MVVSSNAPVDPRCAICSAAPEQLCGCEANRLEIAIAQAEERYFRPTFMDVRSWVRARARDYILDYYHVISKPCKAAYNLHLDTITATCHARCPPEDPQPHYAYAESIYRGHIDRAWSIAVQRYPDVLDYFFSLVHLSLPDDADPAVRPPRPSMDRISDFKHRRRRVVEPKNAAPIPRFPVPPVKDGRPVPTSRQQPWPSPPPSPHAYAQHPQAGWSMR